MADWMNAIMNPPHATTSDETSGDDKHGPRNDLTTQRRSSVDLAHTKNHISSSDATPGVHQHPASLVDRPQTPPSSSSRVTLSSTGPDQASPTGNASPAMSSGPGFLVFDQLNLEPPWPVGKGGRKGRLTVVEKFKAAIMRKIGACEHCRRRKITCEPKHKGATWTQAIEKCPDVLAEQEVIARVKALDVDNSSATDITPNSPATDFAGRQNGQQRSPVDQNARVTDREHTKRQNERASTFQRGNRRSSSRTPSPGSPPLNQRKPLPTSPSARKKAPTKTSEQSDYTLPLQQDSFGSLSASRQSRPGSLAPQAPQNKGRRPLPAYRGGKPVSILSSPSALEGIDRYSTVDVLHLEWDNEDDPALLEAGAKLGEVLRDLYNFTYRNDKIPIWAPHNHVEKAVRLFVKPKDVEIALKIIYYNGHSVWDEKQGMMLTSPSRPNGPSVNYILWQAIDKVLDNQKHNSDVLLIMDCSYRSHITPSRQHGAFEILAASSTFEEPGRFPIPRGTFTSAISAGLQRALEDPLSGSPIQVADLQAAVASAYHSFIPDNRQGETTITHDFPSPFYRLTRPSSPLVLTPLRKRATPSQKGRAPKMTQPISLMFRGTAAELEGMDAWLRGRPASVEVISQRKRKRSLSNAKAVEVEEMQGEETEDSTLV